MDKLKENNPAPRLIWLVLNHANIPIDTFYSESDANKRRDDYNERLPVFVKDMGLRVVSLFVQ